MYTSLVKTSETVATRYGVIHRLSRNSWSYSDLRGIKGKSSSYTGAMIALFMAVRSVGLKKPKKRRQRMRRRS